MDLDVTAVGSTRLAHAFFAGRYHEVLASSIDSPRGGPEQPEDLAFVVGALAFVGRIPEASLLLRTARRPSVRTRTASAFFLVVAHCRAAELTSARELVRRAFTESAGERDSWCRAMLAQAVACCRFFGSDYAGAERAALLALQSAMAAAFPYGQLLANDMRGHLLLRNGRILEALSILERARGQATSLEFTSNAHAIEIAIRIARASVSPWQESIGVLSDLLGEEHAQDSYSRRTIVNELIRRMAYAGRTSDATRLADTYASDFATDARSRASLELLRAHIARTAEGFGAVATILDDVEKLLPSAAEGLHAADLHGLRLGLARAHGDDDRARLHEDALHGLHRSGLYRATIWLVAFGNPELKPATGDQSTEALARLVSASPEDVMQSGLWGLLPEVLGLSHGPWLIPIGDSLVLFEHGDVSVHPGLSPRLQRFLQAIAAGHSSKEALLKEVWGIGTYRPERHDSVIKTSASRLRAAFGKHARWITTHDGAYFLAEGVSLWTPQSSFQGHGLGDKLADEELSHRRRRMLEQMLDGNGSVASLSRRLGIPPRTVSRELSLLTKLGLVERFGRGPATHYRVPQGLLR